MNVDNVLMLAPAAIITGAQVWRTVWSRTPSRPASFHVSVARCLYELSANGCLSVSEDDRLRVGLVKARAEVEQVVRESPALGTRRRPVCDFGATSCRAFGS